MGLSEAELVERMSYLGASDIPALFGLSPFKRPLDVYWSKVDPDRLQDAKNPKAQNLGHHLEPAVLNITRQWLLDRGHLPETEWVLLADVKADHPQLKFLSANLDACVITGARLVNAVREIELDSASGDHTEALGGEARQWLQEKHDLLFHQILEIKTTGFNGAPMETFGRAGSSQVPPRIGIQVQAQLACTGAPLAWVSLLSGHDGSGHRMFKIRPDRKVIAAIEDTATRFWADHVIPQCPPPEEAARI